MKDHQKVRFTRCSCFTRGTIISSIFNLMTTIIGAGTLALPFAFREGGLIFSAVLFFIVLVIATLVGFFLYDSQQICKDLFPSIDIKGYSDLAELTIGKIGRIFVMVVLLVLLYLTLVSYMIYTRDQLQLIIDFALVETNHIPQCWIFHNCAIVTAMAFIPIFPIVLLKNLSPLQFTSTISILCVVFVAVFVSLRAGEYFTDDSARNSTNIVLYSTKLAKTEIALFPSSVQGAITCISYCGLCFLCHFQLFSLEKELHKPRRWKLNLIVVASMLIAYSIYNVVAFAGYLQFGGKTSEDIMTNFPSNEILGTVARVALFFTLLFSYPVLFHPTRAVTNEIFLYIFELMRHKDESLLIQSSDAEEESLLSTSSTMFTRKEKDLLYRREMKPSNLIWLSESWVIFSLSFLPAAFIPNVGYVWNFVGSIGGTLILYIFPPLFLLRLRYFANLKRSQLTRTSPWSLYRSWSVWKDIVAVAIILLGVFILVAGNYVAVEAIVKRSRGSSVSCTQLNCFLAAGNSSSSY